MWKRKELKIQQWTLDNRQWTPQMISYLKRLDKIQIQTHIDPNDWSEIMHPLEMTSPDARTQPCEERATPSKDRAPHTGALTDTERRDISHHKTNHDPAYPEGGKGISQAKYAYTCHTGQVPPCISHCFIPIIYIIEIDRRFIRWA